MKKVFACMLVLMLIFSFSCVKKAEEVVFEPIATVEATPEPKKFKYEIVETLCYTTVTDYFDEWIERFDHCIIAEVVEAEGSVMEIGGMRSYFQLKVQEVIFDKKKTLSADDMIRFQMCGGETDVYICYHEDHPLFEVGEVYFILLNEAEEGDYYTSALLDSYMEIRGNELYKKAPLYLWKEETELSVLKDKIRSVIDGTYAEKYRREDLIRRAEKEGKPFDWYFEPEDYTEEDRKRIYEENNP
ncbi:MAG: hypothetical protein E7332_06780 [Clostridiales bacterium]|nr:hypothetical protein [Clostridiales bacterium]